MQCPRKSIRQARTELQISAKKKKKIRIVRKNLQKPYQLQLMQLINPQDMNVIFVFRFGVQQMLEEEGFDEDTFIFSDESTFHVCGNVKTHYAGIFGAYLVLRKSFVVHFSTR